MKVAVISYIKFYKIYIKIFFKTHPVIKIYKFLILNNENSLIYYLVNNKKLEHMTLQNMFDLVVDYSQSNKINPKSAFYWHLQQYIGTTTN